MADVLLVLRRRQQRRRSEALTSWRLKDLQNPFELQENVFRQRFRLPRQAVQFLIQELRPHLYVSHKGYSIEMQVLTTLRVLGSGSFQNVVADGVLMQISQPTASRFVRRVTKALNLIAPRHIKFPTVAGDVSDLCRAFYETLGFPNVIGAIDCTHIEMKKPSCPDWFTFVNRKSRFSINVQMVCDSKLQIMDVVAKWPGSTHDSHIWNFSGLRRLLSSNSIMQRKFLLGDNGYPLEPWLLTPYLSACSPPEVVFNQKHRHARNVIERCFGLLKSRFRLLDKSGGVILYDEVMTCYLVIAAAVLHNICMQSTGGDISDLPFDDDEEDEEDDEDDDHHSPDVPLSSNAVARRMRDDIAARFQAAR